MYSKRSPLRLLGKTFQVNSKLGLKETQARVRTLPADILLLKLVNSVEGSRKGPARQAQALQLVRACTVYTATLPCTVILVVANLSGEALFLPAYSAEAWLERIL